MKKAVYCTNKDLLREIHNSKKSYCYFLSPEHSDYHIIVQSVDVITPEFVENLIVKFATQKKPKILTTNELVFRVMTHEHIPLDPHRKRKAKNTEHSYARTNFAPFKHYMMVGDALQEVGRSHWQGGFENGCFSTDEGNISNSLAIMFMLIVERYSSRGNWRGYCVDEQTEALTKRGWVNGHDITESDTILSCKDGDLTWSSIKSIYRDEFDGKMFKLTGDGMDALVTPDHKFVTDTGLKRVNYLLSLDKIIATGNPAKAALSETYTDEQVKDIGNGIVAPTMEFILSLTESQRELLLQCMFNTLLTIKNEDQDTAAYRDSFSILYTLMGKRVSFSDKVSEGKTYSSMNYHKGNVVENVDFHDGKRGGTVDDPNVPTEDYKGMVWCPETEYGSFVCRRNGTIYLTGNTYVDEMRSMALLQLSQIGLLFDESKSDNPFAFYTTVIRNCFTRVLNLERRNQNIRDDILIMSGVAPSYTRQVENEMEQRSRPLDTMKPKPKGTPGRKKASAMPSE
jgi:hypothetical protein